MRRMSRDPTYDKRDLMERIDERLRATGKSSEGASIEAGLGRDYIRNLRNDKSGAPRADKLLELAQSLETSAGYLLKETEDPAAPIATTDGPTLPISWEVGAGQWAPVDDLAQEPLGIASVTGLTRYPYRQWVERVKGDSFDRKVPDGALVHVVDAIGMGYLPRHNDVVIVARTKGQGSFVERTMKQVEVSITGKVELWPRSHNPKHSEPLALESDSDDAIIQIVGKVIRAYIDLS
jgi:repressor LexA